MSNGAECCAIGVCCPPGSDEQKKALVKIVMRDTAVSEADATEAIEALSSHVSFGPKSMEPMIAEIVSKSVKHGK